MDMVNLESIHSSWDNFISLLHQNLNENEIEAWVTKIELSNISSEKIVITGLNQFFCNWIRDHHRNLLRKLIKTAFEDLKLTENFQVVFKVGKYAEAHKERPNPRSFQSDYRDGLEINNIFKYFVNGSNTNIAYAAAKAVADSSVTTRYNPLFLCGDVGLGKTHLSQAIGIQIKEKFPDKKILYISSEQFTNEVINGIRYGKINQVRKKFRSLDLLIIDDIHFLENKESTQEEFFHTFNELIQNQKQLIITADRYPREIKSIEERLTSRFSSGMVAKIEPPDFETRVAIIRNEIERLTIPMPDNVIDHIAHTVKSNVRNIKGIIIRLEAEWSLMKQEIDIDTTSRILKQVLNLDISPKNVDEIIKTVSRKFDVKPTDIKSDKRDREISNARQTAMYIVREITDLSYPVIGKHFGGKNHTSVMQACKKIKTLLDTDAEFKQVVTSILRDLSI